MAAAVATMPERPETVMEEVEVKAATTGASPRTPPPPWTILKRPATVAAEVKPAEKKEEEKMERKMAAKARWEKAEMSKVEEAAYIQVSMPIRALDYTTEEEGAVLGKVAHLAGMRAVEDL